MEALDFNFADEIWAYLHKRYVDRSSSSMMLAKARLYSYKMKEGDDLGQHVQNWMTISYESVAHGDKPMENEDKAFLLCNSLPSSLKHLTQTMLYGKDKLSFDDVHNLLLTKLTQRSARGKKLQSFSAALSVEQRGRSQSQGSTKPCPRSKLSEQTMTCWKCEKVGHMKKDC